MPYASHRIDLLIVPKAMEKALDNGAVEELFRLWEVDRLGHSSQADRIVDGGCRRIWLDEPGRLILYANQSGGFRVRCPDKGDHIATDFGRAHRAWKAGAPRQLDCPACGRIHALEHCIFEPPAAFSRWAIILSDVGGIELSCGSAEQVKAVLGPYRTIVRRP